LAAVEQLVATIRAADTHFNGTRWWVGFGC